MRRIYIVSYDITDAKRLRKTFKAMRGFGDHLQYSVFLCELSQKEKVMMMDALDKIIHHDEDQVLIIDLGQEDSNAKKRIGSLGRKFVHVERHSIVV